METRDGRDYLEYKKERNLAKLELRKAVKEYETEIAKRAKRNPKAFYKYVNSKLKTRTGIPDLKTENGSAVVNDKVKADMFNKFFSSVFTRENQDNWPICVPSGIDNKLKSMSFSEDDVRKLLLEINPNKSPGPDKIHPKVLKECSGVLAAPLFYLFKSSLEKEMETHHLYTKRAVELTVKITDQSV